MLPPRHHLDHPYGSSRLASEDELRPLTRGRSPIVRLGNTVIRFPRGVPVYVQGGAGSGKYSNLGSRVLADPANGSVFVLDIGGQYFSTSWHWNLALKREAYALNPFGCGAYPSINHPVNLWGILKDGPYLVDDAKRIARMGVTQTKAGGDNSWVGNEGVRWVKSLLIFLVLANGRATPASFWHLLNAIRSDDEAFKTFTRRAQVMTYGVYATLIEIYEKKHEAPREFGAVFGNLLDSFDWLSSPQVAASVSGDEDYLSDLTDPNRNVVIYFVIPGGSAKDNESLTRMAVVSAQLHCVRANNGHTPLFYLEEAAVCGPAEFLLSAASEFRKYADTVFVYQSYGQPVANFGKAGAQTLFESCGLQVYLGGGVRDIDSAQRLARTLGKTTISVNDPMVQARHAHQAEEAALDRLYRGDDPIRSLDRYDYERAQSQRQRKMGRDLIDPAEMMSLKDQVLIVSPGSGVPPILADKLLPYWKSPAMAGRYGPDPAHASDLTRVTIPRRLLGSTQRKFIRRPAPAHLAHWPNHISGEIAYVRGFRTW